MLSEQYVEMTSNSLGNKFKERFSSLRIRRGNFLEYLNCVALM